MTDTDRLSTPSDLVDTLKRLTTILREVDALPDTAQQRFWDDMHMPTDDLHINGDVGLRTVSVLYNLMQVMCGPRLTELVSGEAKDYYERMLSELSQHRPWDKLLDQKFETSKSVMATVAIHTIRDIGRGLLSRVEGAPLLLKLTTEDGRERYFASKDIVTLEFDEPAPAAAP